MYKIEYAPAAMKDLENLRDYLSLNWGEQEAKWIIKKLTSKIRSLEQFPLLGVSLENTTDIPTEYRYLFTEKNYIFYRIEIDTIRIIRVINERQDYLKHLFEQSGKAQKRCVCIIKIRAS